MHLLAASALFGFVLLAMVPTFHCSFLFGLRSRTHYGNHGRHHALTGDHDRHLVGRHNRNTFARDIEGPREYVHQEDNGEVSSEAEDNGAVSWTWTPRGPSIGSHWKDIGQPYICWFLSGHSILELPYFANLRQWCQHKSGREPRNTAESSSSEWPWKKRWSSRVHKHRSYRRYKTRFDPYDTLKKPCKKTTPWTPRRRTTAATKITTIAPTTPAVSSTTLEPETTSTEMTRSTTNNPTAITNNPVTTTNNPVTTTNNPVTTTNNPVTTTNNPVTTTNNPVTTTNNPVTTTNNPVTTTNNPVTTTNNPVTTTNNPVTTTNDPTTETSSTSTVDLPYRKPV